MIKTKKECSRLLEEFYDRIHAGQSYARNDYNNTFIDGHKKAKEVHAFLKRLNADFSKLAYVSIGGANGAELKWFLQNTPIAKGFLLEYDRDYCTEVRSMNLDRLEVYEGDAWANKSEVADQLIKLYDSGVIRGVIITAFSVLHELPFRSSKDYEHYEFFATLVSKLPEAYFYCKEPTKIIEWNGRVKLDFSAWFDHSDVYKFAKLLQKNFKDKHSITFSKDIIIQSDGLIMDSQLAGEVIKKLVYFLNDGSVDKLMLEVEECHTALNPELLSNDIRKAFFRQADKYEYNNQKISVTSETFQTCLDNAQPRVESVDQATVWTPNAFTRFTAYFRPKHIIEEDIKMSSNKSDSVVQQNPGAVIHHFYDSLRNKKILHAFDVLSPNFKEGKYQNSYEYFEDGFKNTHNIFAESAMELTTSASYSRWIVHYDELVHVFNHPVLSKLTNTTLQDFPKVIESITAFKEILLKDLKADNDKVDAIPLINFFSTNAVEECCWLSGIQYDRSLALFEKEIRSMTRVRYVNCVKSDDKWYIDDIRPVLHSSQPFE